MNASLPRRLLFSRNARRLWMTLLLTLSTAIVALALTPGSQEITPDTGLDKVEHVLAFALLSFCGVLALWSRPAAARRLALGLLLLGAGIELAQTQVPGRTGGWDDLLADAVGIALGLVLTTAFARALERRRAPRARDAAH